MPNVFSKIFLSDNISKKFIYTNILVFFLTNIGNLFQFLFQILSARLFIPSDLSIFGSINSLNLIISAPILIVPMLVVRLFEKNKKKEDIFKFLLNLSLLLIFFLFFFFISINFLIKDVLNISEQRYLNYGYLTIILSFIISCCFGFLQGLKKYLAFGILHLSSLLIKFLVLIIFFNFLPYVDLLFISSIMSIFISFFIFMFFIKNEISILSNHKISFSSMFKSFFQFSYIYLFTSIIFVFMSNIDISISRILLDSHVSGLFVVASSFSKIPLYLTLALTYVLFPELKIGDKNYEKLFISISFIIFINILIIIGFYFFGSYIISILYGYKYLGIEKYILFLLPTYALLNVSNIIMIYFSKNNNRYHIFTFFIFSIPFLVLLLNTVDSIYSLSYFIFIYNLIFFLLNLTIYFSTNNK